MEQKIEDLMADLAWLELIEMARHLDNSVNGGTE